MPNIDAAAGVTQKELNVLLDEYYENAPDNNNPFKGSVQKDVPILGNVTVTWDVKKAPSLTFGAPTLAVWNAALNSSHETNGAANTSLPTLPMVQVLIPELAASYTQNAAPPVGGITKNVVAYATLDFSPGEIKISVVAVTIDEKDFSPWDKEIFNLFLLPKIFESAAEMLSVVHLPTIDWQGVALNPVSIMIQGTQLLAAATLTTNPQPLDVTGVTWPTDPVFVIASTTLINAALAAFMAQYNDITRHDDGEFSVDGVELATWEYTATVKSLSATVKVVSPLTITAEGTASLNAQAGLTPAGMALAAVGCAAGTALLVL